MWVGNLTEKNAKCQMPLGLPALPGVVETNDRCITVLNTPQSPTSLFVVIICSTMEVLLLLHDILVQCSVIIQLKGNIKILK
jgi:hypothetical protein